MLLPIVVVGELLFGFGTALGMTRTPELSGLVLKPSADGAAHSPGIDAREQGAAVTVPRSSSINRVTSTSARSPSATRGRATRRSPRRTTGLNLAVGGWRRRRKPPDRF